MPLQISIKFSSSVEDIRNVLTANHRFPIRKTPKVGVLSISLNDSLYNITTFRKDLGGHFQKRFSRTFCICVLMHFISYVLKYSIKIVLIEIGLKGRKYD